MRFPKKGTRSLARIPRPLGKAKKAVTKSLTKNQKKEVKLLVAQPVERKYIAQTAVLNGSVPTTLITPIAWGSCIPVMTQGVNAISRIGNKVRSVVGRTQFNFAIDGRATNSQNFVVKLFLVQSRKIKSYPLISSLPAGQLLDAGNNNSIDWSTSVNNPIEMAMMPLSKEDYIGKIVTIKLSKNVGLPIQDSTTGNAPNSGLYGSNKQLIFNWKHAMLQYDDQAPGGGTPATLPTNFAPLFAYVAYAADGTNISGQETVPILASVRCEMSWQDE